LISFVSPVYCVNFKSGLFILFFFALFPCLHHFQKKAQGEKVQKKGISRPLIATCRPEELKKKKKKKEKKREKGKKEE